MRKLAILSVACVAGLGVLGSYADDVKKEPAKPVVSAGLERFKALAGEWTGTAKHGDAEGHDVVVNYKATSAGSAIIETIAPNTEHEMVTMITQDKDDLALTHYCALGNQPKMKASSKVDGKSVAFSFVSAGNLKSENDMHMHNVTYTFVDDDTLKAEWTMYRDGKAGETMVMTLKRKK